MRFLITTDTVGGVWNFTKELATELLRRGHHVALVSIGPAPNPEHLAFTYDCYASFAGTFSFVAPDAPLEWMQENATAYEAAKPLLLNLCREFNPDVLLLSQFCFGALPVTEPKIVVAHSDVLSWAEAVGKAPLKEDAWLSTYRTLVQRGLDSADVVVAPTRFMLSAFQQGFAVSCETFIIPNGRSVPAAGEPPVRALQAITAGRLWDEAKNVRMLREVSAPVPVCVAGDSGQTPDDGRPGVRFLGRLSEVDLIQRFRASAMYICTSLYEPFGLAPLEAALCGCAVLANDIPSLREVWADGALYFHDAASLSALLHMLNNNPKLLQAAQERSGKRAAQFTAARMADGYLALAERMIAREGSAARAA